MAGFLSSKSKNFIRILKISSEEYEIHDWTLGHVKSQIDQISKLCQLQKFDKISETKCKISTLDEKLSTMFMQCLLSCFPQNSVVNISTQNYTDIWSPNVLEVLDKNRPNLVYFRFFLAEWPKCSFMFRSFRSFSFFEKVFHLES